MHTCHPLSDASWVFSTRRCNVASLFSNICSRWSASWLIKNVHLQSWTKMQSYKGQRTERKFIPDGVVRIPEADSARFPWPKTWSETNKTSKLLKFIWFASKDFQEKTRITNATEIREWQCKCNKEWYCKLKKEMILWKRTQVWKENLPVNTELVDKVPENGRRAWGLPCPISHWVRSWNTYNFTRKSEHVTDIEI